MERKPEAGEREAAEEVMRAEERAAEQNKNKHIKEPTEREAGAEDGGAIAGR